ncbi:oxaloacetate decarboxylase [Anaerosporobacter sp.]
MKKIITIIGGMIGILLIITGVVSRSKQNMEISIIGGADGPTSIFLAGKVGNRYWIGLIVVGIIILCISFFMFLKKKK